MVRQAAAKQGTRTRRAPSENAISMRVSPDTLGLIDTAARASGKTRTEFVLDSARRHAIDVLLDQRVFVLDDAQHHAFMHVLDEPPAPSSELKALMASRSPWET